MDTRQDPSRSSYRETVSSQYAVGDLGHGGTTVHDLAQAHLRGAVHRVLAPADRELPKKDIPRGRRATRTQGQVGAALFGSGERHRIRLLFLPPYSPEINPDELVWNDVKNNGVGRTLIRNVRDLNRAVNSRLRLLQKNPDKVRAFFQMETTRYAAAA